MKKIKVKGKWQYFDGDRRITEAEYNAPKKESKKPATNWVSLASRIFPISDK